MNAAKSDKNHFERSKLSICALRFWFACIKSPKTFHFFCIWYILYKIFANAFPSFHKWFFVVRSISKEYSESGEKYFETTWKINVELRSRKVFTLFVRSFLFILTWFPFCMGAVCVCVLLRIHFYISLSPAQSRDDVHKVSIVCIVHKTRTKCMLNYWNLVWDYGTYPTVAFVSVYAFSFWCCVCMCVFHMVSTMSSESNFC